jgi:hypothetical protein
MQDAVLDFGSRNSGLCLENPRQCLINLEFRRRCPRDQKKPDSVRRIRTDALLVILLRIIENIQREDLLDGLVLEEKR